MINEFPLADTKKHSYLKKLKGEIYISHCKGYDTIIIFPTLKTEKKVTADCYMKILIAVNAVKNSIGVLRL